MAEEKKKKSFFGKIVDMFVETDEVEIDEGPVEPITIKKTVEKPIETPAQIEPQSEPIEKEERKTIFIDAGRTSFEPELPVTPKVETIKPEVKPRDTYEFTPIISPFFGANKEQQVSRVIPKPQATNKPSRLGTIISPIYGVVDDNKIEKEESLKVESMVEENIATFSLDDMIQKEVREEPQKEIEIETLEKTYEEKFTSYTIEDKVKEINPEFTLKEESTEEIKEEVKEETSKPEEIVYTPEELEKQASIKKVMQEYSEEELFERDNQPTLFDL